MEIERKFLVKTLPDNLTSYESHEIEQAYLCTEPVMRIRRQDTSFIFTYKSKGLMIREEIELPLEESAYKHLLSKADGYIITKRRFNIPTDNGLTIELDIFTGLFAGLIIAEVEFPSEEAALTFIPPDWFDEEVTMNAAYHNSNLSTSKPPLQINPLGPISWLP